MSKIPVVQMTGQMPEKAMLRLMNVLITSSRRYGPGNWRGIPPSEHLDHAVEHLSKHMAGDKTDSHLVNCVCRLLFYLDQIGE